MTTNQPTIEQNSQFVAKTKDGKDIEFVATIKFYVAPTESVQISAPGSKASESAPPPPPPPSSTTPPPPPPSSTATAPPPPPPTAMPPTPPPPTATPPTSSSSTTVVAPKASIKVDVQSKPDSSAIEKSKRETEVRESGRGIPRDESIDRAFPRGPPDDECPITQFIPDPCRAIDDLQKSVKAFLSGFFGSGCPPCKSDSVRMADSTIVVQKTEEEAASTNENKAESEAMQNEQKYEV